MQRSESPSLTAASIFVLAVFSAATAQSADVEEHGWPAWRGPLSTGVAPDADPPLEWSETKNIRWKVAVPGVGHSTPIIWGDHVYVTTAIPYGEKLKPKPETAPGAHDNVLVYYRHRFEMLALRRSDGKTVWRTRLCDALPHEGGHYTGSLASNSPVTNGRELIASFGSRGVYCLDMKGKLKWKADLGEMRTKHGHGEGSSPSLHKNTVVVNWDHEGQSFLVAYDTRSGKRQWRKSRREVTSWATPIVVEQQGKPLLIVSGTERVRGYDLSNGDVIWECGGLSHNIVASPVSSDGMVYAASSYEKRALLAIKLAGAKGDISGSKQVAWTRMRGTPYVPSPLLYRDSLYFLRHYQGILTRVIAKTGEEPHPPLRLGVISNVYASPVAAADRVYITDLEGTTLVISHGEVLRPLAVNRLDDSFSASAAIAGGELYLRGNKHLYCIAKKK